jgi:hypothetical protein
MNSSPILSHIPPPAALAEQWLHCLGLKALLNSRLDIHLDIESDPGRRRFAFETWVEVLDPPIFHGSWARLVVRLRRRPPCGGILGDPGDRRRTLPATLPILVRACRTCDTGYLAAEWCMPPAPPAVFQAQPAAGEIIPSAGSTDPGAD